MKLSVSLPDDDVVFLDSYADFRGIASRSAVLHQAVRLLRATALGPAYAGAWDDWITSDEASLWEPVTADGLTDQG